LCAGIFGKDSFDHIGFEVPILFKANGPYDFLRMEFAEDGRLRSAVP
jgi:hypothetical protein